MQYVVNSISGMIGNTPLLHCKRFSSNIKAHASIYAKLENLNPTGSIKDRAAFYMLEEAIKEEKLRKDSVVVEPTSGNTGIGLAALCASVGIRCIIVMPDTMSPERIKIMKRYGAEVILTPGALGMQGSIDRAKRMAEDNEKVFVPSQFENPANPLAHYRTTGPEIWRQTEGKIDVFISAVGSGGTLTGTARYLLEKKPDIRIVAVEPEESPVLSGGPAGAHGIQGIGAGFVPDVLDVSLISEIITVPTKVAILAARKFIAVEGAFVGISSGAAVAAAAKLAVKEEYEGKNIVLICPDSADRYYGTALFDNE